MLKNKENIIKVVKDIKKDNFVLLSQRIYSEEELKELAKIIKYSNKEAELVYSLIFNLTKQNRNYDWNCGSILQHLSIDFIIEALKKLNLLELYNSIGLAWVLGEFRNTNRIIVDFLYAIIKNSFDSDAWWRAAFSLEKLGVEEAVNLLKMSLKNKGLRNLNYYLNKLNDKKSIISILVLSNVDNVENKIYPKIKEVFLKSNDCKTIINCCWLIGRLKLIDDEIYQKLILLINHNNYELKYYTFFALQNNASEMLRPVMEKSLLDPDPLIRKMAARGLLSIGNEKSLDVLEQTLYKEKETSVISEISKAIYNLKNPFDRSRLLLEMKSYRNENGMISDESDKWYSDPAIYHTFSEAEDPENVCFNLILEKIKDKKIINPIDLATGTGRITWQIIEKIDFKGQLLGVDASGNMCEFVRKTIKRERKYTNRIKIMQSTISELSKKINIKSNLIISSFGFPSKISNPKLCVKELKSVYSLLLDDGIFCTIGWDETFNDELNMMWFKYIPDKINAQDFEEWRKERSGLIKTPRNCNLSWFKRGIDVPLQFSSLKEAAYVIGYFFGIDAAQYVVKTGKMEWVMSLGITYNTKNELKNIIKRYERN